MIEDFSVKLQILSDILEKKKDALQQILDITENQSTVLESLDEADQWKAFFFAMNEEKQKYIDIVLSSDEVFEKIFQGFGSGFENQAPSHTGMIKALQEQIKNVTDLDIRIRVCEEKNKANLSGTKLSGGNPKIDLPKASKSYMLKQYANNSKKT